MLFDNDNRFVNIFLLWNLCFENVLKILLEKVTGRSKFFIISERQSSLTSIFRDRNPTLQEEAIPHIVCIALPDCG